MKSTIVMAFSILVVGAGAGVVANTVAYKLDWVRQPKPPVIKPQKGPASQPGQGGTPVTGTTSTEMDPKTISACEPRPDDKPMTVRMECVLYYLENGGAFIVDAREDHEYDEGHLKGAVHLPVSKVFLVYNRIMEAGAQVNDRVIVYCGGGDCEASHDVADVLRQYGHQDVLIYEKGWQEIESSGLFGKYVELGSRN